MRADAEVLQPGCSGGIQKKKKETISETLLR